MGIPESKWHYEVTTFPFFQFRKQSRETRYFIMNKILTPEHFLRQVRSHWAIETSLLWVLDVTMNEDYLRNRTGPENLAVMRRLALNLARLAIVKRTPSIRGRLKKSRMESQLYVETHQFGWTFT